MTLEEIENELSVLKGQKITIQTQIAKLTEKRRAILSKQFIKKHSITRENVELSSGDNKPFFAHIDTFATWLRANNITKRFVEWNGTIYHTKDITSRKFPYGMPATVKDLE